MKKPKIIIIISLFLVFTGILHAQTVTVTLETPSSQKQETTQNKDSEKEEKDPFIHEPFLFVPVLNFYGGNVDYLAMDVGVEILKYPFLFLGLIYSSTKPLETVKTVCFVTEFELTTAVCSTPCT